MFSHYFNEIESDLQKGEWYIGIMRMVEIFFSFWPPYPSGGHFLVFEMETICIHLSYKTISNMPPLHHRFGLYYSMIFLKYNERWGHSSKSISKLHLKDLWMQILQVKFHQTEISSLASAGLEIKGVISLDEQTSFKEITAFLLRSAEASLMKSYMKKSHFKIYSKLFFGINLSLLEAE